ncbi:MAG: alpha/beta hydrolase, partial [Gammaproteobacteria bacterium]
MTSGEASAKVWLSTQRTEAPNMNLRIVLALISSLAVLFILYAICCALIAHRFTHARRIRVALPPAGIAAAPVRFEARDGLASIDAWHVQAPQPRGAVILVPGRGACRGYELRSATFPLVQEFVAAGLSVMMIDLRGHGTSSASRMTYGEHERHDVLGAFDWLNANGYSGLRIGVLGASMGAAAALFAAADEPAIAALVVDSPFAELQSLVEQSFRAKTGLPRCCIPGVAVAGRMLTGLDLRRVRPIDRAPELGGRPMLVVHNEDDRLIPVGHGRAIAEACGAELWTRPSGGHVGAYRCGPEIYAARMVGFFVRHLTGNSQRAAANDARMVTGPVARAAAARASVGIGAYVSFGDCSGALKVRPA